MDYLYLNWAFFQLANQADKAQERKKDSKSVPVRLVRHLFQPSGDHQGQLPSLRLTWRPDFLRRFMAPADD